MAVIKPFKGILYNTEKVDINRVVTPPYDVISRAMQEGFYRADPHNIIRLILGKTEKSDNSKNNKYTRAKAFLDEWSKQKILLKDTKPFIYVYELEYLHKGKKKRRIGFIALMKIEDPKESGVLPHEYTLSKPKEDRLNLISKVQANLSAIFTLFQDEGNNINRTLKGFAKATKEAIAVEMEGVIHRFWKMKDKKIIDRIRTRMRGKKIFIADGHHRYEVSLTHRNKMRNTRKFKKDTDYVMMYFSSLSERQNLTILSTHRVVKNIRGYGEKKIEKALGKYFNIKPAGSLGQCMKCLKRVPRKKTAFGMYTGKKRFKVLALKKGFSPDNLVESGKTRFLSRLDVTILHDLVIGKILGVKNAESSIKYIRNENAATDVIDRGDYQAAFFLRPTDVRDMKTVAEKGEMMPQKSTYFYPKLLTGLVINKF